MLKIIEHDFIDSERLWILVEDTETGEIFNGIIDRGGEK